MMEAPVNGFKAGARLWASQPPLVGESRASWIQRICGDHQYSFAVLNRILRRQQGRLDWDRHLASSMWGHILEMTERQEAHSHGLDVLSSLSQWGACDALIYSSNGVPRYRWCGACFASDRTPYLRWYWRLAPVRECWDHRVPLNEQCELCSEPFHLDNARLVGRSALSLAECPKCGIGLDQVHDKGTPYSPQIQLSLRTALAHVWSVGHFESEYEAALTGARCLRASHGAKANDELLPSQVWRSRSRDIAAPSQKASPMGSPYARAQARSAAYMKSILARPRQDKSWKINAESFQSPTLPLTGGQLPNVPWQWKLSARRRMAIADALWKMRQELRAEGKRPKEHLV